MDTTSETTQSVLTPAQKSAVSKAIFINWLLHYAKKYPDEFPVKEGRVVYEIVGDSETSIPMLSKEEILAWHNKNRPHDVLTEQEFDAMMAIQKANGLVTADDRYYSQIV